eukprot:m.721428 g.721428  ORF g.721428 m.721428 type:complete len:139 (-) comp58818_c0_seq67:85-501(-)
MSFHLSSQERANELARQTDTHSFDAKPDRAGTVHRVAPDDLDESWGGESFLPDLTASPAPLQTTGAVYPKWWRPQQAPGRVLLLLGGCLAWHSLLISLAHGSSRILDGRSHQKPETGEVNELIARTQKQATGLRMNDE